MAVAPPLKRLVPWKNREEWMDVYLAVFSNDPERQQFAEDRLSIWKIRSCENLALAPELTWQLLSLKLKDKDNEKMKFLDDGDMRTLYGIYIIRFVNYVLEASQNAKTLIPLRLLAQKVGMPQWILELRHSLTYDTPPKLDLLREAVDQALIFLKNNYWIPQSQYTIVDVDECKKKFNILVDEYFQLLRQLTNKQKFSPEVKSKVQELHLYVQANCKVFLKILSENESLIFPSQGRGNDVVMKIPKILSEDWRHMFDLLIEWQLVDGFLDNMLSKLSELGTDRDRSILAWICFICNEGRQKKQQESTKRNFNSNKLLLLAMKKPNRFTPFFIDKFCGLFPEIFKHRNQMLSLLKAYGIGHPWLNSCLDFTTLEQKGQENVKESNKIERTTAIAFDRNSAIVKIEKVEWQNIVANAMDHEPSHLFPSATKRPRPETDDTSTRSFNPDAENCPSWKFGSCDEPSVASELTWKLLSLKSLDARNEQVHFLTDYQMRSIYGMHVIRFVEKTLRSFKTVKMATPLEQIAKRAGLPLWIADLRHEAAHQSPPELFLLRDAADFALKFLKINFWIPQTLLSSTDDCGSVSSFDEFFQLIKGIRNNQTPTTDTKHKLQKLEMHVQTNCKALFEILVEDTSLIFPLDKTVEDGHDDLLRIPESLAKEWMPMLDLLINWNLIHGFMGTLLNKLSEDGSDQDRSILAWMCFVCNEGYQRKQRIATKSNYDAKKILYLGAIKPNKFTPIFVNKFCNLFPELLKYQFDVLSLLSITGCIHPWQDKCINLDTLLERLKHNNTDVSVQDSSIGDNLEEHNRTANILQRILFDEKDFDHWKYPLGVNPLGYFGMLLRDKEQNTNEISMNGDDSMEFIDEDHLDA